MSKKMTKDADSLNAFSVIIEGLGESTYPDAFMQSSGGSTGKGTSVGTSRSARSAASVSSVVLSRMEGRHTTYPSEGGSASDAMISALPIHSISIGFSQGHSSTLLKVGVPPLLVWGECNKRRWDGSNVGLVSSRMAVGEMIQRTKKTRSKAVPHKLAVTFCERTQDALKRAPRRRARTMKNMTTIVPGCTVNLRTQWRQG